MDLLYNIGIGAYRLAVKAASLRNRKARLMLEGQAQTMDRLRDNIEPDGGYIWVHASSLGEFEQGRPLIERIKRERPEARVLLSFFSPSGYEVRKNYPMADVVVYLPFDVPQLVKQFLDLAKPAVAIFVKYEFWGNYLTELQRRGIPTYVISAHFRPSQVFFKPWGGMFRRILRCFTTIFVQNEDSRQLLKSVGITRVEVSGDTRFDRVADVRAAAREFPTIAALTAGSPFTLVAGSTWPADEDLIIPYFNSHPDMKLILAPHEFDRERLHALMARVTRPVGLYSETSPEAARSLDCVIIDSFGLLSSLYRYGNVAYVGGGFGAGIHNICEAAVYGIPVVFGPNHGKFREATELVACDAAFTVASRDECEGTLNRLIGDKNALQRAGHAAAHYINSHTGATEFIYNNIPQLSSRVAHRRSTTEAAKEPQS